MPTPKKPLALAKLDGSAAKDPQRYRDRHEPQAGPLGAPPGYLTAPERLAWAAFAQELPWLVESDRALLALACALRAQVESGGELSATAIRELRMILSAMGATPTTRQNVQVPPEEDANDPWAAFGPAVNG